MTSTFDLLDDQFLFEIEPVLGLELQSVVDCYFGSISIACYHLYHLVIKNSLS